MILLAVTLIPTWAMAQTQTLKFKDSTKDIRELEVLDMLSKTQNFNLSVPYGIASFDLNDDGVDEWIVRDDADSGCGVKASCRYIAVGLSEKKPIVLGQFYASNLAVLDKKMFGVHGIAVYNNPNDDFKFIAHHWNPKISAFSTNF